MAVRLVNKGEHPLLSRMPEELVAELRRVHRKLASHYIEVDRMSDELGAVATEVAGRVGIDLPDYVGIVDHIGAEGSLDFSKNGRKYIEFTYTLAKMLNRNGKLGVMAHEEGHFKIRRPFLMRRFQQLSGYGSILAGGGAAGYIAYTEQISRMGTYEEAVAAGGVALSWISASVLASILIRPLTACWSRREERLADIEALKAVGLVPTVSGIVTASEQDGLAFLNKLFRGVDPDVAERWRNMGQFRKSIRVVRALAFYSIMDHPFLEERVKYILDHFEKNTESEEDRNSVARLKRAV